MSGHSKWANIKHRKAAQDAKRGNLFQKLVRAIIIAAKDGGGDPAMNMRLKTAIERAKAVSVPNDNITRAIKRGTGELGDISYDELTYEVIGPAGIAILVNPKFVHCLQETADKWAQKVLLLGCLTVRE